MLKYLNLKVFDGRSTLKSQNSACSFLQTLASVRLADKLTTCHWAILETRAVYPPLSSATPSFAHHLLYTLSLNPAVQPGVLILNAASKTGCAIFNLLHSFAVADGTRQVCVLAPGKDRNSLCNVISAYFTLT